MAMLHIKDMGFQIKDKEGNIKEVKENIIGFPYVQELYKNGNKFLYNGKELTFDYFQKLLIDTHPKIYY